MKFGSVCSGIEAASVAFEPLGFTAQWFSEIEHFPSEVLKYRYPSVPNLGDMTKLTQNETFRASSIDLLVGGTPCQSFSVAGLRRGLADPRGNLMLTFLSLADAKKPRWIVWENVPGVLSSNGGRDFGTFLGALGELGYGFAYRILDAQHFGVAQRRRRVFVVGYLGDWRPAAAVLFERESLSRDSKPSRKKGQETPTDAEGGIGESSKSWWNGEQTAPTLTCSNANGAQRMPDSNNLGAVIEQVAQPVQICFNDANGKRADRPNGGCYITENPQTSPTVTCAENDLKVLQPIAYSFDSLASNSMKSSNPNSGCREVQTSKTIDTTTPEPSKNQGGIAIAQPVHAFKVRGGCEVGGKGYLGQDESAFTISTNQDQHIAQPIAVDWRTAQVDVEMTGTLKTDLAKMSGPCIAVDCFNQTINEKTTQTIRSQSDTEHIGTVMQPISLDCYNQSITGDKVGIIREQHGTNMNAIAVDAYNQTINDKTTQTIGSSASDINHIGGVLQTMAIRRLTPKECERLQGFPDDWTQIPYRNKPADQCPDGPRYKACGNSMAVPVMRWIGQRIQLIDTIIN